MIFYEKEHIYKLGDRQFTSVTQVLSSLEKKKDWKKIAKRYADKNGKTVAEVEALWKEENDKSVIRGKEYHAQMQNALNNNGVAHRKNVICQVVFHTPAIHPEGQFVYLEQPDFKLDNNTIYTEFMVWDEDSGICGMVDEAEVVSETIHVNDHKTNKEIKREGFYVPNGGREKLLSPVSHLDDCNWNKYTLQLSLYMYLLWKRNKNLKVGKLTLNHVQFDKEGKMTAVVAMDVPYRRDEVRAIIDWWKTKEN